MKVAEINDEGMKEIAQKTRELMMQRFTPRRINGFMQRDPEVAMAFTRSTWLALREYVEKRGG